MSVLKSFRVYLLGILFACITASFGFGLMSEAAPSSEISGTYHYNLAWDALDGLNAVRIRGGASALKRDQYLTDIAMLRAAELSVNYSHTRPDGTSCFTAGDTAYFQGENMAKGFTSADAVNAAWLNSEAQLETVMNSAYTGVGIGCFEAADGTMYWTQCFGVYRSAAKKQNNSTVGISADGQNVSISKIENLAGGIRLRWKKISGVSGYYVYRKTAGESYTKIKTIKKADTVTYKDTSVKGTTGTKYKYKVIPYTKSDGKKGTGTAATIVRVDRAALKSVNSNAKGTVDVKWKAVSGVTGYKVFYSLSPSFSSYYYYTVKGDSTKTFTIKNLSSGSYYIRVCAYKKKGGVEYDSGYSNVAEVAVS